MKILALYSIKGGVGKTSAAVNLSYQSARAGYRTLLWDLDPQGAASFYFRIQPKLKGGIKSMLGKHIADGIKATDFDNLDLLPADFTYRNLDLVLDQQKKRKSTLARVIDRFGEDYDCIFLDCAPSISLVSENVFRSAHCLLNPVIPSTLSIRTLNQLTQFLDEAKLKNVLLLNFFSMVDRRRKMHNDFMESLRWRRQDVLQNVIPDTSIVERMGLERKPVAVYASTSVASLAYQSLWYEIEDILLI